MQQGLTAQEMMERLQAPFPANDIEWRVNRVVKTSNGAKAIVLAYVTNRAIQARFDELFGPFGWKNEYKEWRDKGVLCGISVTLDNGSTWVTKWDGADATNVESTKGGFSAAMKRSAVQFGVGRYLYNLEEVWVDIKDRGQNYIADNKTGAKGYWDNPQLPAWALPQGNNANNVAQLPVRQQQGKQAQQPQRQQQTQSNATRQAPKTREEKVNYIAEREAILGLNDIQKLKIFNQVNANSGITSVPDIYTNGTDIQLNNYMYAIKPASIIKELAARNNMDEYVLNYLSGQMNKQLKSFIGLISVATNKTVKEVNELITKAS
ncbi:Rad52/Rad22 family DNA repair protein [Niallia taxi]|uniref:Rad52/Rad22 family DNA repair protein n=1 Tax=Niallia taxi TaxID=2499688 RepID=UPI0015F4F7A1|nr:Rad52/Rad22 family DNA repair protein [Niallia taxi]